MPPSGGRTTTAFPCPGWFRSAFASRRAEASAPGASRTQPAKDLVPDVCLDTADSLSSPGSELHEGMIAAMSAGHSRCAHAKPANG